MKTKNYFLPLLLAAMMCAPFTASAQVTIGSTELPEAMLDIRAYPEMTERGQGFRLIDGNEFPGRVLTVGEDGIGTWVSPALHKIQGQRAGAIDFPLSFEDPFGLVFRQTGASVTLPPGAWEVRANILISIVVPTAHLELRPLITANDFAWLRSTFSDSPTLEGSLGVVASPDIVGGRLISGSVSGPLFRNTAGTIMSENFGLVTGSVIINNTSDTAKTYYFLAGWLGTSSNFEEGVVARFNTGAPESTIVATPILLLP